MASETVLLSTATATAPSSDASFPLLSPTNVLAVLNASFTFITSSLSYLAHVARLTNFLVLRALQIASYTTKHFRALRPLQLFLAPVRLAIKIMLTPVIAPALLVFNFVMFLYPLYTFLGAACVCGACVGILARGLGKAVLAEVFGARRLPRLEVKEGKEVGLRRRGRSRTEGKRKDHL